MDRIPILRLGSVLLVSIQVDLEDQMSVGLQEDIAEMIVRTGADGVIIDITALEIVDSFTGRMLSTIAAVSRVLDADTVVVGMRPAVAITLVELGLSLAGVRTALDVDRALAMLAGTGRTRAGNVGFDVYPDEEPVDQSGSGASSSPPEAGAGVPAAR